MKRFYLLLLFPSLSMFSQPSLTEVILPQYIQGINGTNNNRVPYAFRVTISGLIPNATYRYFNQVVISSDGATFNGAGNVIFYNETGSFYQTSSPSLSTSGSFGEFTTNASGSYTGWFITEPSGNTRFTPGNNVIMRIMLNDGAGGTTVATRLTTTNSAIVANFGTSSSNISAIWQNSLGSTKDFVVLYDNVSGTGRPIACTYVENVGITYATSIASWYRDSATANGRWGAYVNNNNSNGIRRIEVRDHTTGNLKYVITDSDGQWGAVNTANATSGTTPLIIPSNSTENFTVNGTTTIPAGRSMEVSGTLTNNGTITLEATSKTDYARLIYGAVSGTGTVNHQMRLVPGTSYKWYAIGSPVDGININSIGTGQFTASSVYNWSATGGWSSAHTGTFTRGQGVFIAAGENSPYGFFTIPANDSNIVFSGSLSSNTSAVVRSLDYGSAPSGVTFSASPGVTQGWNLLANPYHADFDLNGLDTDNGSTEKSLSIRTPTGYTSYNPTTNTPSSARYLSPGEAFFVRANTTGLNFTFALSRRSASGGDGLLKTQNNFDRINIRVSKNDRTDEMYVLFKSDATTGFDGKYDAYKFNRIEGYPMIYSVIGNVYYSINTLPSLSGSYSLPTRFTCTEAGAYTISLFDVSDFDPSIVVTLEDKLTNTFTMLNNGDYTFTHNPSNNPDRFVLHFNKSAVSTTEREADKVNVWVYNGVLYIKGFENLVMPLLPKRNLINFEMCLIKS